MKKSLKIQEYINNYKNDIIVNQSKDIGGTLNKRFVRVESKFLIDMFKEISRNPNTSYVTYLNDFIIENQSILFTNPCIEYTSALLKEDCRMGYKIYSEQLYSEICASRLGNFMGYPIVYNQLHTDANGDNFVISVDFVKPNCEISLLDEIFDHNILWNLGLEQLEYFTPLEDWLKALNMAFDTNPLFTKNNISNEDKTKICNDFVSLYLFRQFTLDDADFKAVNVAILHNTKNNRFELAPNFDMEMCFKPSRAKGYDHEFAMVNIDYCARNYADILDDFIDRMKAVNDRKKINKLFKSEIKDPKMLDKFVNYTLDNASKFLKNYNEYILDIDDVNLPN